MAVAKKTDKKIKITLLKSTNGILESQKKTIQALGLKKINSTVEQFDNDAIQGMIFVVRHLIKVESI